MDNKVTLFVEDNPRDEALTLRALKKSNIVNGVICPGSLNLWEVFRVRRSWRIEIRAVVYESLWRFARPFFPRQILIFLTASLSGREQRNV
jgi:hypothetical protein